MALVFFTFLLFISVALSQLIPCEQTVNDFTTALESEELISSSLVDTTDFIFDDVTRFLGCNHTHFDVLVDGNIETYPTDVLRFDDPFPEECGENGNCYYSFCVPADGHGHNDGGHNDGGHNDGGHNDGGHSDGGHNDGDHNDGGHNDGGHNDGGHNDGGHEHEDNSTHGHDDSHENNGRDDNATHEHDEGHGNNSTHDHGDDHGDGDDHHDNSTHGDGIDHHDNSTHGGGHHDDGGHNHGEEDYSNEYYLPNHVLLVGHATVCCSELNLDEAIAHHTCALNTAFAAPCTNLNAFVLDKVKNADFVGVVHPPEHPNGFPDGEEPRKLQHGEGDHDHGDGDHDHGDGGHDHGDPGTDGDASASEYYFVGCNNSHVDLFFARHIFTYALTDLYGQSAGCHGHGDNATEMPVISGECVQAACLADSGGEHNHGRLLQHDHSDLDTEGIDFAVNSEYYLEGYALYSTVYDQCCHEVSHHGEQASRAASECTTTDVFGLVEAASDGEDDDTEDDDGVENDDFLESTGLYILGGGVLGVVFVGGAIGTYFKNSRKKEEPETTPETETPEKELKV